LIDSKYYTRQKACSKNGKIEIHVLNKSEAELSKRIIKEYRRIALVDPVAFEKGFNRVGPGVKGFRVSILYYKV